MTEYKTYQIINIVSVSSSCWEFTWYEDYVEAILSGEEQFEEQFDPYPIFLFPDIHVR